LTPDDVGQRSLQREDEHVVGVEEAEVAEHADPDEDATGAQEDGARVDFTNLNFGRKLWTSNGNKKPSIDPSSNNVARPEDKMDKKTSTGCRKGAIGNNIPVSKGNRGNKKNVYLVLLIVLSVNYGRNGLIKSAPEVPEVAGRFAELDQLLEDGADDDEDVVDADHHVPDIIDESVFGHRRQS
jgi:hypothetical protein